MPWLLIDFVSLFVWGFMAATMLPGRSERAFAAIAVEHQPVALAVVVATLGSYLGACTTYWLGYAASRWLIRRRAFPGLEKFTGPALLLSGIPFLGHAIVAAAGLTRVRLAPFSLWIIAGKGLLYLVVAAFQVAR